MKKLSDLVNTTAGITQAAMPSQFAMHALNRNSDGLLTYTKVLWSNTSETVDMTNGEGFAYLGIEEFITGEAQNGILHNTTQISADTPGFNENKTYTIKIANNNSATPKFLVDDVNTASLIFTRGSTYTFNTGHVSTQGFPLYISTSPAGGNYASEWTGGVINSRSAAGGSNTDPNAATSDSLTITVPQHAPDILYYASGNHANLYGVIVVRDSFSNLNKRKYEQVRFDTQKLTYFVNEEGFLVARYNADYNY